MPAAHQDSRYGFHRVLNTFVRLDGQTGQVSVCSERAGTWSCQAVPDDRAALESEIGRLLGENAMLKQQLAALQQAASAPPPARSVKPPAAAPDKGADKAPDLAPETRMPSDADFERAMSFLTRAWRRMVEMMADLQRDIRRRD